MIDVREISAIIFMDRDVYNHARGPYVRIYHSFDDMIAGYLDFRQLKWVLIKYYVAMGFQHLLLDVVIR